MSTYRALSAIKYSDASDPQAELVVIEAGEKVEGLPVNVMKELWNAGALEKVDEAAPSVPDANPASGDGGAVVTPAAPDAGGPAVTDADVNP